MRVGHQIRLRCPHSLINLALIGRRKIVRPLDVWQRPEVLIMDTRPTLREYPVIPKFVWSYANPIFGLRFPVIQTNPDRIKILHEGTLLCPLNQDNLRGDPPNAREVILKPMKIKGMKKKHGSLHHLMSMISSRAWMPVRTPSR